MRGKISAGGGMEPDDAVNMRVAFRRDWVAKKGAPEKMSLIKVEGDSMEPTLLSGDLVLVDHNKDFISPQGGIYAISIDHEIMIKRVQPLPAVNKIKIISDNGKYEPHEVDTDQVKVNGKVIWFAREIEK
jgi:phage repressor protein C with HTH and peptisase S24 domain